MRLVRHLIRRPAARLRAMSGAPVVTLVHVWVKDGQADAFAAASLDNASHSAHEPGNLRFDALQYEDDPLHWVLVEAYETKDAAAAHKETPHYLAWRARVADMMAKPREGVKHAGVYVPATAAAFGGDHADRPMTCTLVNVWAKDGTADAFAAASVENAGNSVREDGNVRFDVLRREDDPNRFVLVEAYVSKDKAAPHKETAHYKKWRETVADMMAQPREGVKCATRFMPLRGRAGVPTVGLRGGARHPLVGFGTYKVGVIPASAAGSGGAKSLTGTDIGATVRAAADAGYRMFDCAQFYENEAEVGAALGACGVPREELFLVSKVWCDAVHSGAAAVTEQVERSLRELQTSYIDLYLVHWPVPKKHVEAYKALLELKAAGKVRAVGVSNYTIEDYQELIDAGAEPPEVNQIEVNPFLWRAKTVGFFQARGVVVQAYRPLANGKGLGDAAVARIAGRVGRTPAQVLGRWAVEKGVCYIPKSEKPARIKENFGVLGWSLGKDDVAELDGLTTEEKLQEFRTTYLKCIVRDTPMAGDEAIRAFLASRPVTVG